MFFVCEILGQCRDDGFKVLCITSSLFDLFAERYFVTKKFEHVNKFLDVKFYQLLKFLHHPIPASLRGYVNCYLQEQVNAAATFPDVLRDMERWMKSHRLGKENRYAVVTDG